MNDELFVEAFHYLLDDLEPAQRAVFEAGLTTNSAQRAALKICAAALTRFACDTAPAETMRAIDQRAVLASLASTVDRSSRVKRRGQRYGLPLAAALLLVLNLWQLAANRRHVVAPRDDAENSVVTSGAGENTTQPKLSSDVKVGARTGAGRAKPADGTGGSPTGAAEGLQRLDELRDEYTRLVNSSATLRSEYDRTVRELAQRAIAERGVGRLAAMELVDAGSYARGDRKGLMDLARGILTEPGMVALGPTPIPTQEIVQSPATTAAPTASSAGADAAVSATPSVAQSTPESAKLAATEPPYAWSVFDETQHQGYLNLYNLPIVTADQSLQVWVKPADTAEYHRVGEVPTQLYGGSGSVYYKLPDTTNTPVEILITQEPRATSPPQPSGQTVLHGP